jgi:hypothetical protein
MIRLGTAAPRRGAWGRRLSSRVLQNAGRACLGKEEFTFHSSFSFAELRFMPAPADATKIINTLYRAGVF